MITFEKASATTTSSSASATANPLDPLNPFSPSSPLNPANPDNPLKGLEDSLGDIASNLTDAVNDGLGDAVNELMEDVVEQTGVKDLYYVYVQKICSGSAVGGDGSEVKIDDCRSYKEASDSK